MPDFVSIVYSRIAQNYAETVPFHKIFTLEN